MRHTVVELHALQPRRPTHPLIIASVTFRGPSHGRCGSRRNKDVAMACDKAGSVERLNWQEQALAGANLHRRGSTLNLVPASGVVAPQGAEAARKGGQDNPRRPCW